MEKNNIKILHIFSGVGGGISTWIRKAAIYSRFEKICITNDAMAFSITNKSNFMDIVEQNGGRCIEMPRIRSGLIKMTCFISKTIKIENYDIIHCHIDGIQALPIWIAVHLLARKPLMVHSHRTAIEKIAGKKYEKSIYKINRWVNGKIADYKISCGERAKEFAFGHDNNVITFYNGINPVKCERFKDINDLEKINILALGRLSEVKNHSFMLEVVQELKDRGCRFHLYIVGDGELRKSLQQEINNNKLKNYVTLEGYCNTPGKYLSMCDTLIMPSFSEGLPTAIIEAQEYGCNVIASDTITRECDLNLNLVSFMGICKEDVSKWANIIIHKGKKKTIISREKINNELRKKGFLNKYIYSSYYSYVVKVLGDRK